MTLKFKPSDFPEFRNETWHTGYVVHQAQRIFDEWLASQGVVYGQQHIWTIDKCPSDTHQARLVCIEPLVKEKCTRHRPPKSYSSIDIIRCVTCNAEIKPTWSEVNRDYI